MNNIFEKNSLIVILLKIFDIYLCHYLALNKDIAITHLWHAIEPKTICHLIVKEKVAEEHILRNTLTALVLELQWIYSTVEFQSSYYSAIQCATGLKLYYVIAYQQEESARERALCQLTECF